MQSKKVLFILAPLLGIVIYFLLFAPKLTKEQLQNNDILYNEYSIASLLRTISTSQAQFQSAAQVDQDQDGAGEYGFLKELAGYTRRRGNLPPVSPTFIKLPPPQNGIFIVNGYCLYCYIPGIKKPMGENIATTLTEKDQVTINNQEVAFIVYAWPLKPGITGRYTFAIDQSGEMIWTKSTKYNRQNHPPAHAALNKYVKDIENLTEVANGEKGQDNNFWHNKKRTSTAELMIAIKDKRSSLRESAASGLGKQGAINAIGELIKVAKWDREPKVQSYAVFALEDLFSKSSQKQQQQIINTLIISLTNRSSKVRMSATYALKKIRAKSASQALIKCVNDPDESVKGNAISALMGLNCQDPKYVQSLFKLLKNVDRYTKPKVAKALGQITPQTDKITDTLLSIAKNYNDYAQKSAITALDPNKDKARQFLLGCLKNSAFVEETCDALGRAKKTNQEIKSALLKALKDMPLQLPVIKALHKLGVNNKKMMERLLQIIERSNFDRRAIETLKSMDKSKYINTLKKAIGSSNLNVKRAAIETLQQNKVFVAEKVIIATIKQALIKNIWNIEDFLSLLHKQEKSPQVVPLLKQVLQKAPRERAKAKAATILAEMGPKAKDAIPLLKKASTNSSKLVRDAAQKALKMIVAK